MKNLVCIVCPRGCTLTVEEKDGGFTVTGNSCRRGYDFAQTEMTCPMRTVCSTVATVFPEFPAVPVRVNKEIPKDRIFDVMREINSFVADRKLKSGETVIQNVLGLGADVICTSDMMNSDL